MKIKNKDGFVEYQGEEKLPDNTKAVEQWDLEGHLVKRFRSIAEASRETGCGKTGISKCLSGKQRLCGGWIWKLVQK